MVVFGNISQFWQNSLQELFSDVSITSCAKVPMAGLGSIN